MDHRRRVIGLALLAGALIAGTIAAPAAAHSRERTYRVTIETLTAGQPLTPPVLITHKHSVDVFSVGRRASDGVRQIAENGNPAPLVASLDGNRKVHDIVTGSAPVVPDGLPGSAMFGDTVVLEITSRSSVRYLSWVSMLICTNDGFTGVDAVRLPRHVGDSVMRYTKAYDAGTERNTEDFADIVPPCQGLVGVSSGEPGTGASNPALETHQAIRKHRGVHGIADLVPSVHGWDGPVAKITIERIG